MYRRSSAAADGIVDVEDRAHRLVLEPLPGVARIDAGPRGELRRRGGAALCERAVQTQPVAEIHRLQVERGQDRAEQPAGELVASGLVGRLVVGVEDGGHRQPPYRAATAPRSASGIGRCSSTGRM